MKYTILIALLTMVLSAPSVFAQASDWRAVQMLPGGTRIHVTLINGHTFGHCALAGVDDDQLSCERPGLFGMRRRTVYPRSYIRGVYRVHNGALIGLGVGVVAGATISAATYSKHDDPNFGRVGTPIVVGGLLGGLGMGIGGILDPFFHGKAVYRNTSPPAKQPRPKHAQKAPKDDQNLTVANEENADQSTVKIPCLRDGVTLQCVE